MKVMNKHPDILPLGRHETREESCIRSLACLRAGSVSSHSLSLRRWLCQRSFVATDRDAEPRTRISIRPAQHEGALGLARLDTSLILKFEHQQFSIESGQLFGA